MEVNLIKAVDYQPRVSMEVYSVRLQAWHAIAARKIGKGCMGDGIRLALEQMINRRTELPMVEEIKEFK